MDLTRQLPEDVLADVLRRVAPCGLAACRCACKALRAIIDAHRLLRADLLPLSVGGIFIDFHSELLSEFFARPSTRPAISGRLDYLPRPNDYHGSRDSYTIEDHCNGLLLLDRDDTYYVVNPATRQWDPLPTRPSTFKEEDPGFVYQQYLVFDPMLSPHYEVFLIPHPCFKSRPGEYNYNMSGDELDPIMEESEWPPSVRALHVFSSRSGCWEERSFIRQGKAARTIADMPRYEWYDKHYGVYYGGALYVHCKTDSVMRIYLSNNRYEVIKPPMDTELSDCQNLRLGRSEKGLYFASTWLDEQYPSTSNLYHLLDINFNVYVKEYKEHNEHRSYMENMIEKKSELNSSKKEPVEEKFEWDSENDNILYKDERCVGRGDGHIGILGFHPYKEIIFLDVSIYRGLAYHLKDSKVQDLGYLYPTSYYLALPNDRFITGSFSYTPCWLGHQKATRM
ncbi:uncharacterized protein LOC119360453 [Triticum dicoccoides]|uniref:uncharacterized protein LOC119360453 n=1 Tax=Triticum dicoccoides TaxID=85692 RepID=UPI00188E633C|nr:uncharacterized protein LOC119360453 [Triticum dicoccoides]